MKISLSPVLSLYLNMKSTTKKESHQMSSQNHAGKFIIHCMYSSNQIFSVAKYS